MEIKYSRYFAYGSNMSLTLLKEMGVLYRNVVPAILAKHKLVFNVPDEREEQLAFASVVKDEDNEVKGLLMEIDEASIKILDEYEAYPNDYLKEDISVKTLSGEWITCFMYKGNPAITKDDLKPWPKHLAIVEQVHKEYFK